MFLPTKLSVFIKNHILHQSKNYKNHFENSNFWDMWPLGHVGHVTYNFINMLFISTGIFGDKLRPQILSVGTNANAPLNTELQVSRQDFCKMNWRCTLYTTLYVIISIYRFMTLNIKTLHVYIHKLEFKGIGLGLWCLTPLSIIFQL
jgi:hypothetical protein